MYYAIYDSKRRHDYFAAVGFTTYFNLEAEQRVLYSNEYLTYLDEWKLSDVLENLGNWLTNIDSMAIELETHDPWEDFTFNPPKGLTSGIQTIDFDSEEAFSEEEQRLIESDLDKTQEFIRNEVGMDEDRIIGIEKDIADIKQELSKRSKFSWKEYAREKLIDELVNAAKNRFSLMQLYKLFEFLGPFDLPQLGI